MKLPLIGVLSGVALTTLGLSSAAQALTIVPSGLNPGDRYRLVFVTSGTRDATSSNIADYNTFVNNAAHASSVLNDALTSAGFTPSAINWTAIASTATTSAKVNTATQATDTSRPIYRLDGALVATSYTDLWDSSIGVPINRTEQDQLIYRTNPVVWTGTTAMGNPDPSLYEMGRPNVKQGYYFETGYQWVAGFNLRQENHFENSLYGISDPLTVALVCQVVMS